MPLISSSGLSAFKMVSQYELDDCFDGSNWESLNRLSTQSFLARLIESDVDSDQDQCAWLARQFRGPALDYVAQQMARQTPAVFFANFDNFLLQVTRHFGISDDGLRARRRGQLEDLKWNSADLPVFFAEFDRLSSQLSITSDSARIAMVRSKLPERVQKLLAEQALDFSNYDTMRERLLTMWALDPHRNTSVRTEGAPRKRPRCGRGGKKGHAASDCRSSSSKN